MRSSPTVLAVDAGSTTVKAQLFDAAARPLAPPVRRAVPIAPDARADALVFAAAVEAAVDEALRHPGGGGRPPDHRGVSRLGWTGPVDAVALSCAWHGLVGLGADGQPTTRLSTWAATGPAEAAAADELRRRLGGAAAAVRRRTGAPVHPSLSAARLLAEATADPEAFGATARWCSIGELLESRWLAGTPGPSSSMASATGLYDQEARTWDADVLAALRLPPGSLASVDDAPRGLARAYADRWPALAQAVWWPAVGDGACALLGTGCARNVEASSPGSAGPSGGRRAALTVGTSAAVRVLATEAERAARPAALFAYLLDADRVVLGAARSNAGNLAVWLGGVLRLGGDVVEEVAARPPGGHGLLAVPALAGERSPDWPLCASGSIAGLHPGTTALDVAQAFLEAAVCGLADSIDTLEGSVSGGGPAGGLQLIGSGRALAASPAWRRLVADATGRPLIPSRVEEASARGAALAALEGLGWLEPGPDEDLDGEPVLPDPARRAAFARLRAGRTRPPD